MTIMIKITDKQILKSYEPEYLQRIFEIFLKYEFDKNNYAEFWKIDYDDLTTNEKKSIDEFDTTSDRTQFITLKEYLWELNK